MGIKASDFIRGQRVLYIPLHADGDEKHPHCEWGTVSSTNDKYVFVKFDKQLIKLEWNGVTSQACDPSVLKIFPGQIIADPEQYFGQQRLDALVIRELFKI